MPRSAPTVLLVDPDPHARALLARHLESFECQIAQASDGPSALRIVNDVDVALVVTELYLVTGDDECLIHAIRRDKGNRRTRIVAHTHRSLAADREWCMRAGADAYLIKPTRAQRVRFVVGRLTSEQGRRAAITPSPGGPMARRDSLDLALHEIETGHGETTACIVFGRAWWNELSAAQRKAYRTRAKTARVSLRSDSMLSNHFVEVRTKSHGDLGLSTEQPESPYRR
ncbi:MAG: response regulator [Gemmatimonadaceae bacterium]